MATLPYITSPGNIDKALNGIKKAGVPERVTLDFVKTILKIPGGSGDQINSFLKKISLVNSDGTPNETYRKFRNPTSSGKAIAQCIKDAYAPLYVRNEYMHELNDEELIGLVVEETGHAHDSNPVKLIVSCIQHLKSFSDFSDEENNHIAKIDNNPPNMEDDKSNHNAKNSQPSPSIGLNLGYTINLNLPATSDPAVFDAIFKSLKENLLSAEDA
ncbi:MAG: DUF5343 domain-containing protein [Pseudomonadota bacterium]|nr:hypothetical protein [Pseudomonadota bacterium]QKK05262.1 MAG: DUF5343 domain-containing protein [Pseudomonadota bacterium]|tara:strand:+ start:1823 stop:2467 length:645 start_codon:yes stop_codon:yes gene_type:complete